MAREAIYSQQRRRTKTCRPSGVARHFIYRTVTRHQGGRSENASGKVCDFSPVPLVLADVVISNLREVLGAINELSGRSSFSGLNNADQLPKITGLMEDVRDATMDYQVCHPVFHVRLIAYICCRHRYSRIATRRPSNLLYVLFRYP